MSSQSTSDGTMTLNVTFKLGTNLDTAQNLVQNRVATAEPRLPDQVRSLGVTTKKKSPNLMMVVNLLSPDNTYDQTYISKEFNLRLFLFPASTLYRSGDFPCRAPSRKSIG